MTRQNPTNILLQIVIVFSILIFSNTSRDVAGQSSESNLARLTKCSEYRIESPVSEALAADTQRIFVGTADGSVQSLDLNISSGVWRTELGGEIVSNIVPAEMGMVVVSNPVKTTESVPIESVLRSLSKETGIPNWTARLPFSERFFLGSVQGAIEAVSREGSISALDSQTGRILWRTPSFGKITAHPSFSPHGIVLGTSEKQIFVISPETGEILFKGSTDFIPTAVTNPTPDVLVAGDERGNVASIGVPGGKNIWKFKSGAAISFVSVSKEGLFITSLDNFIYLISMYNGDVIWKRRLPGRVIEGGLIVEGFVIVLIYGENSAFLIDTKKGKILDQLPQNDKNFVNQVPVLVKDGKILVTTPDAIAIYSISGCGQK